MKNMHSLPGCKGAKMPDPQHKADCREAQRRSIAMTSVIISNWKGRNFIGSDRLQGLQVRKIPLVSAHLAILRYSWPIGMITLNGDQTNFRGHHWPLPLPRPLKPLPPPRPLSPLPPASPLPPPRPRLEGGWFCWISSTISSGTLRYLIWHALMVDPSPKALD